MSVRTDLSKTLPLLVAWASTNKVTLYTDDQTYHPQSGPPYREHPLKAKIYKTSAGTWCASMPTDASECPDGFYRTYYPTFSGAWMAVGPGYFRYPLEAK